MMKLLSSTKKKVTGASMNMKIEHEIELTDDLPVVCKDYRMSQKELSFLKTFIDECLEAKIIRKSTSPYNATPIMIPKPDGSMRPVIESL